MLLPAGYHRPHETHTLVVLLFQSFLVRISLSRAWELVLLLDRILYSGEFNIPSQIHQTVEKYKRKLRHLRYLSPKQPFSITNKIPRDLPKLLELDSIAQSTWGCAAQHLPSDGSCLNLVIEEPFPINEVPTSRAIPQELRSREVILHLLQYDAEVFPFMGDGRVAKGYIGDKSRLICCKIVDKDEAETFETLQRLGSVSYRICNLLLPPFLLPTGQFLITMPHYGQDLSMVTGPRLHGTAIHTITRQLLEAVQFLHTHNLYHLDIKPQNLALAGNSTDLTVIDLGWMMDCEPGFGFTHAAGTSGWVSPEVQRWHDYYENNDCADKDDEPPSPYYPGKPDVWAIGKVIVYLIDRDGAEPLEPVRLRAFAEWLMLPDPIRRPNINHALAHFDKMFPPESYKSPPALCA
ncbi:Serine/threonine-protein kinase 17A [Marasmius crinis-equi]|uniref:Serine/threonine-protein kinase 17A n=1 Tax=Marasmius crinis-equi TaxID=585013 RepID=A0ABR3F5F9_9AGAR